MNGDQGERLTGQQSSSDGQGQVGGAQPTETGGFYRGSQPTTSTPLAGADLSPAAQQPAPTEASATSAQAPPKKAADAVNWVGGGDAMHGHLAAWRARMIILSLLLAVLLFAVTRDWLSSIAVAMIGLVFGTLGSRRPRDLQYSVDPGGVTIGARHYSYAEFRAFSVFSDRMTLNVELVPLKRFMPAVMLHLDQRQSDEIVATLSRYLPMQNHQQDLVDRIVSRVKI